MIRRTDLVMIEVGEPGNMHSGGGDGAAQELSLALQEFQLRVRVFPESTAGGVSGPGYYRALYTPGNAHRVWEFLRKRVLEKEAAEHADHAALVGRYCKRLPAGRICRIEEYSEDRGAYLIGDTHASWRGWVNVETFRKKWTAI